jgi:hypothetical protein
MKKSLTLALLFIGATTLLFSAHTRSTANAATLTSGYVFLSRIQEGLTSGVEMVFVVDPSVDTDGSDTLTIMFPDDEDGEWCETAGTLTSTVDMSGYIDVLETVTNMPGTLTASCAQGSGAGSYDTITISGIGAMTGTNAYGVKVVGNTGALGTGDDAVTHQLNMELDDGGAIQTYSFDVALLASDQVTITATVSDAPSVNCTLSTNSLDLGTLFTDGSYVTNSHTVSVLTSANASGYYVATYGTGSGSAAGLYDDPNLLESDYGGGATVNLATAEGYGLRAAMQTDSGDSATVATRFSNATSSVFGTISHQVSEAEMVFHQATAETAGDTVTITHGASAGASAVAGNYSETVTFMCGGYY